MPIEDTGAIVTKTPDGAHRTPRLSPPVSGGGFGEPPKRVRGQVTGHVGHRFTVSHASLATQSEEEEEEQGQPIKIIGKKVKRVFSESSKSATIKTTTKTRPRAPSPSAFHIPAARFQKRAHRWYTHVA